MPTARLQVSDVPETGFFLTASVSTDLFHQSFHSFPFYLICSAIEDRSLSCVHRVSCTSQMSYLRRVSQMSNKHVDTGLGGRLKAKSATQLSAERHALKIRRCYSAPICPPEAVSGKRCNGALGS